MLKVSTFLRDTYFALCKSVDTPVSLACWLRFKHGEFSQLVNVRISPHDYLSAADFAKDYFVVKYLSKQRDLPTGIDTESVATSAWKQAEEQCRETNARFRQSVATPERLRAEPILHRAQRKIADVLGELDVFSVLSGGKWGPGATSTLSGARATLEDKIREFPYRVTSEALPYFRGLLEQDIHWLRASLKQDVVGPVCLLPSCFTAVRGCKATLVEKNAKTKRSIAIEPTGNIFLQLGVGSYIRSRLMRVGVDLNDQTWNQSLAYYGSVTGAVATIDFSSASDTISRGLVMSLLPLDWFLFLDNLRSKELTWDKGKTWVRLEKFSSMGNGFTFELESLIFWAIASACVDAVGCEELLGVYGDDVILPVEAVPLYREVTGYCGFTFNEAKTYGTGLFRESCGCDFFGGVDVTPVYQKDAPSELSDAYRACNRLLRYGNRRQPVDGSSLDCTWVSSAWLAAFRCTAMLKGVAFKDSLSETLRRCAKKGLHAIPLLSEEDSGLLLPLTHLWHFAREVTPSWGLRLNVLEFRPFSRRAEHSALLAYWLRFSPETSFDGRVSVRRRGTYRVGSRYFYDLNWKSHLDLDDLGVTGA